MNRRELFAAAAACAVAPCALAQEDVVAGPGPAFAAPRPLAPIDARADRIVDVSVCTRPFRAEGPRIEAERVGAKTIVHNYGHGGSGWSLSWGAADLAVGLALRASHGRTKRLAVIGCGAIGLTTAIAAQRAGFRVRIHASERPPEVRSSNASGVWSPDSRICTAEHATPEFAARWEAMARRSWWMYQRLLGLPGDPVEWHEMYVLSNVSFEQPVPSAEENGEPGYPHLARERLRDLESHTHPVAPGSHPFPVPYVRRFAQLTFNIAGYARMLMADFEAAGGELVTRTFASPREFASLPEPVIVNATGYGARELLDDVSLIPVRGQTVRLVPQPEVDYGLYWRGNNVAAIPRRDGLLVQAQAAGDFGNPDVRVDRAAAVAVVAKLATLFPRG